MSNIKSESLNFGPQWLRNMGDGSSSASGSLPPSAQPGSLTGHDPGENAGITAGHAGTRYKLAEHRYGREEMLALFNSDESSEIPDDLRDMSFIFISKALTPLALTPMNEDEQSLYLQCVNSQVSLRGVSKNALPVVRGGGFGGGARGDNDRGRGRGRGRDDENMGRMRPKDTWEDNSRTRGYDHGFSTHGSHNQEDSQYSYHRSYSNDNSWRQSKSFQDADEGDFTRVQRDKWGPKNWRQPQEAGNRQDSEEFGRPPLKDPVRRVEYKRSKSSGSPLPWDDENGQHALPEWSTTDAESLDNVGTFDSSGAFLATKEKQEKHEKMMSEKSSKQLSADVKPDKTAQRQTSSSLRSGQGSEHSSWHISEAESGDGTVSKKPASQQENLTNANCVDANSQPEPAKNNRESLQNSRQDQDVVNNKTVVPEVVASVQESRQSPWGAIESLQPSSMALPSFQQGPAPNHASEFNKKEADSFVAKWTPGEVSKSSSENAAAAAIDDIPSDRWYYRDPQNEIQGPFGNLEMNEWFASGYFSMSLLVRAGEEGDFNILGDLIKKMGRVPFLPKPIAAPSVAKTMSVPGPTVASIPTTPVMMLQDPMSQQQQIQQQLLQQQQLQQLQQQEQMKNNMHQHQQLLIFQQQQQQQQQLLHQQEIYRQMVLQQQQQQQIQQLQNPEGLAVGLTPHAALAMHSNLTPSSNELFAPFPLVLPNPAMTLVGPSIVPGPNITVPSGLAGKPDAASRVWGKDLTSNPNTLEQIEKLQFLNQEKTMERLRFEEQQKLLQQEEEREKLERLKHEEEERMLLEEQRRRLEEMRLNEERRLAEDQHRRREELRMVEEQRMKLEEERRRVQELQNKMEEERRQMEIMQLEKERIEMERRVMEERLQQQKREEERMMWEKEQRRLMEEQRKQEEEQKKREEQRRVEEQRRLEEQKRQDEERQKKLEEDAKKKVEIESKLKSRAEKVKPAPAPAKPAWSNGVSSSGNGIQSFTQIQEADFHEMTEDGYMRKQKAEMEFYEQQQKQLQQSLSWTNTSSKSNAPKSLLDIQLEQASQLTEEKPISRFPNKPQVKTPEVSFGSSAAIWGTGGSGGSLWGSDNSKDGLWDIKQDSGSSKKKSSGAANVVDSQFPALGASASTTAANKKAKKSESSNKNTSKLDKEEAVVQKLFAVTKVRDDFTKWCEEALAGVQTGIDIPTLIEVLKDIDSQYEVMDLIHNYLGNSKQVKEFSRQFLDRRNNMKLAEKPKQQESFWGPVGPVATAQSQNRVNPHLHQNPPKQQQQQQQQQQPKGEKGKKKKKMQKVDNSILGFTVLADPDRINMGQIDNSLSLGKL